MKFLNNLKVALQIGYFKIELVIVLIVFSAIGCHQLHKIRSHGDLIVNTESGLVRGHRFHIPSVISPIDAYLGIPFAKPPVKKLRFRHPQPYGKWEGVYNATRLPNSCFQMPDTVFGADFPGSSAWNPTTKLSEDCLYLNIWVPKTTPKLRKSAVMVWIYGGGFYSGTTTLNVYDGKILAANSSIIVVSVAYRVGAFGFLTLNHPSAPGNAGLFDQLMALEWIQRNIKYFGGDPENITLFGESAGAVSISMHLLSPLSHSKFQRAILQSGVANMPWAFTTMEQAKRRGIDFAIATMSCNYTDIEVLVDCLREVPDYILAEHQYITRGIMQFPFIPVIDGSFLPEHPKEILKKGNFKHCPILLGSNKNEATFFLIYELTDWLNLTSIKMTKTDYLESMNRLFFTHPHPNRVTYPFVMESIQFQYANWLDEDNYVLNTQALDAAVSEYHFICPVNQFAQLYASLGENVYMYYFTQRYSTNPWPAWMGVLHGDEIMFVFGEALKSLANYSEDDKKLSRIMTEYWVNFAKTGDPNQIPGVRTTQDWPLYTPNMKEYLELNSKFLDDPDSTKAVGRGPRIKECAFWDEYIPQLNAVIGSLVHPFTKCRLSILIFTLIFFTTN
ncbi:hypothetical protein HELRODRAFT_76935 [Helobdella robusta]|uniref:Carboxylic ester hydrolase n=1 Tax=Helobdella robusta TaxID=6412 RepID=T1G2R7_HELRO|nr:hypothetical protein HELRODRAFT_76935 [Helobdella robusta]ESO06840.1 hypothetical protein HELRODRAFT_76935 [Helobdella robusta]